MRKILALALTLLFFASGCSLLPGPSESPAPEAPAPFDPSGFLTQYNLQPEGEPARFDWTVPATWEVPMGEYPEGLYWGLANEFSKDIGLDLTSLKGGKVNVWRYNLAGGLPGEGSSSQFQYPTHIILLVQDDAVVGGWLSFNTQYVGPSLKKQSLTDITGLTFEEWVEREQYFMDPGPNSDLTEMEPVEVLNAFFTAINEGDHRRANACLSPRALFQSLTMNQGDAKLLYHKEFNDQNSMVENITHAKLLSHKFMDPDHPVEEITQLGNRSQIEVMMEMELTWRMKEFNSPTGKATRFTIMEHYPNGWKLTGLGTGP